MHVSIRARVARSVAIVTLKDAWCETSADVTDRQVSNTRDWPPTHLRRTLEQEESDHLAGGQRTHDAK